MSKSKKKNDSAEINSGTETEILEQQIPESEDLSADSPDLIAEADTEAPEIEKEQASDWEDRYLRIAAEYENYRRRSKTELESLFQEATCAVVCELLPVLDSFDSALSIEGETKKEISESEATGISLIYKQLINALNKVGVEEIKALGEKFDPTLHQAVMSVEDENAGENEIVEVFQKGYKRGDRVIRHSMVKVAN
ncbi:MAG: nucleotide exchange factor GrpE [Eubacteriales bacterium]|nr:nucleotide exchange factor GrpE [Eubacteriales bacterium]MDD4540782.1 nucleotide exchange factor GrpE [Eubacteriales bacterium]